VQPEEARARLSALGFGERDVDTLFEHFTDAERRGKSGHGYARIPWLESLDGLDPRAAPVREGGDDGYERWGGGGALGYLTLAAATAWQLEHPPAHARLVVCSHCFPTGMLSHYVRRLAVGGFSAVLTATSPPRLAHPRGGPKLDGTNPLAIGIPSSDGRPLIADVSMGRVTYGDVIAGHAREDELVPFGGEHAHKAFALAVALQALVDSLVDPGGYGAVLLVARADADPVPALRERAGDVRLPGDS
jgi:LDH2 family malate/lactate/ureidoglycolate dehydrogenase